MHRNISIDKLLKNEIDGRASFVRVQRESETLEETIAILKNAAKNKGDCGPVTMATIADLVKPQGVSDVLIVPSAAVALENSLAPIPALSTYSPHQLVSS